MQVYLTNGIVQRHLLYLYFLFFQGKLCDKPLLRDTTIFPQTSAVYSGSGDPKNGYVNAGIKSNGWCASGPNSYLFLDLQKEYRITKIAVMSDKEQTKWSSKYSFKYSRDNITYNYSQVFIETMIVEGLRSVLEIGVV